MGYVAVIPGGLRGALVAASVLNGEACYNGIQKPLTEYAAAAHFHKEYASATPFHTMSKDTSYLVKACAPATPFQLPTNASENVCVSMHSMNDMSMSDCCFTGAFGAYAFGPETYTVDKVTGLDVYRHIKDEDRSSGHVQRNYAYANKISFEENVVFPEQWWTQGWWDPNHIHRKINLIETSEILGYESVPGFSSFVVQPGAISGQ